jgi:hypothetical protein
MIPQCEKHEVLAPAAPSAFLNWPGWNILGYACVLAAAETLWWLVIFHGADYLTSLHEYRARIHLDAELSIPFVPAMVLGYVSINLLFVMAPFVLRRRRELHALTITMAVMILVAGIGFLLVPSEAAFAAHDLSEEGSVLNSLIAVAKRVALRHNMVPSLHIALGTICVMAYADRAHPFGKALLYGWATLIAASTLLIHQHHLIDVVTGLGLAWAGKRFLYDRWLCRPS